MIVQNLGIRFGALYGFLRNDWSKFGHSLLRTFRLFIKLIEIWAFASTHFTAFYDMIDRDLDIRFRAPEGVYDMIDRKLGFRFHALHGFLQYDWSKFGHTRFTILLIKICAFASAYFTAFFMK